MGETKKDDLSGKLMRWAGELRHTAAVMCTGGGQEAWIERAEWLENAAARLAQAEAELTQKLACIQVLASGDEPNVLAEFPAADDVRRLTHRLAKAEAEREQHERYVAAVAEERRFTEARIAELQALLNAEYPELVPATVAAISGALQKRIAVLEAFVRNVAEGADHQCHFPVLARRLLSPAPKLEEGPNG